MASQRTIDPSHLLVFSHSAATRSTSPPSSKLRSDCPMIYLSDCRSAVSHTHSQLFHPVPGAFFLQLPTDETVFLADALHGSASGARVTMTGSSHTLSQMSAKYSMYKRVCTAVALSTALIPHRIEPPSTCKGVLLLAAETNNRFDAAIVYRHGWWFHDTRHK
ncbi:hypothetical protein B0I73DRAFT_169755 [Yarrowia lipolytica]|nr:hypothetical protein B0I73DRAFT_169755 [Yarrowia lipolytica]